MKRLAIIICCTLLLKPLPAQPSSALYDTLCFKYPEIECTDSGQPFFKYHNLHISTIYYIEDSLSADLDQDGFNDRVLVLTPNYMLQTSGFQHTYHDSAYFRSLVVLLFNPPRNRYEAVNILYQQLSDVGGVLSEYSGMAKTDNGFRILHQSSGNRVAWDYEVTYQWKDGTLTIEKLKKNCRYFFDDGTFDTTVIRNSLPISARETCVTDTLKNGCGCYDMLETAPLRSFGYAHTTPDTVRVLLFTSKQLKDISVFHLYTRSLTAKEYDNAHRLEVTKGGIAWLSVPFPNPEGKLDHFSIDDVSELKKDIKIKCSWIKGNDIHQTVLIFKYRNKKKMFYLHHCEHNVKKAGMNSEQGMEMHYGNVSFPRTSLRDFDFRKFLLSL